MDLNETLQSLPPATTSFPTIWCTHYAGVGWFLSDKQQETDAEIMLVPATTTLELFGELDKLFSLFLASRKEISKRFMS